MSSSLSTSLGSPLSAASISSLSAGPAAFRLLSGLRLLGFLPAAVATRHSLSSSACRSTLSCAVTLLLSWCS